MWDEGIFTYKTHFFLFIKYFLGGSYAKRCVPYLFIGSWKHTMNFQTHKNASCIWSSLKGNSFFRAANYSMVCILFQTCFDLLWEKFWNSRLKAKNFEITRTTDNGHPERAFFQRLETFGLGQTIWAEILWGIWGIFGQTISTILVLWVPCPLGWLLFAKFLTIKKLIKPLKDIYKWITKLVSKWL